MTTKTETIKCPDCGTELEDAGCYKVECPNELCNCFPVAMEEWWWEDWIEEEREK
jgi:hypothetical protein